VLALLLIFTAAPARAWDRGRTEVFAVLPELPAGPVDIEGLTVGPDGTVYTPTFGFNSEGAVPGPPHLFSFKPNGKLLNDVALTNSAPSPQPSTNLVGLVFQASSKTLLICDLAQGIVWQASPITGRASVFMNTGLGSGSGLNGLTFDKAGNVYVADSLQGVIWETGPNGGTPTTFVDSQTLSPETVPGAVLLPPLGANGVEFNNDFTRMYVTNTAIISSSRSPRPSTVTGPCRSRGRQLSSPPVSTRRMAWRWTIKGISGSPRIRKMRSMSSIRMRQMRKAHRFRRSSPSAATSRASARTALFEGC
jgi:hypothetical protein